MNRKTDLNKLWSFDRRYLKISLALAAFVWLGLGLFAVLAHALRFPPGSSLAPPHRRALLAVTVGWPVVYAAAVGMMYVMGLFQEGAAAAAAAADKDDARARAAANVGLNGAIVLFPAAVAVVLTVGFLIDHLVASR